MELIRDGESLFGLGDQELDAVAEDINLHFLNYKFFYAVDAYDFGNFFFPYLTKMVFSEPNASRAVRESIAYDTFFSARDEGSIILLNEYKEEVIVIRDAFLERVDNVLGVDMNIDGLSEEIDYLIKSGKSIEEVATMHKDFFFLLLIFLQRKGDMKELSFVEFMRRKLYFNEFDTGNEEFDIYADEAFRLEYSHEFVEVVFDRFLTTRAGNLRSRSSENKDQYLYNTLNDIMAIGRLLRANQAIESHEQYGNTVFYYLSSTPTKSKVLFDIIQKAYGDQLPHRSHFTSGKSIHRNIMQIFLFTLLVREFPDSKEMPIEIINYVKEYRTNPSAVHRPADGRKAEVVAALNRLMAKVSAYIDNHFLNTLFKDHGILLEKVATGEQSVAVLLSSVVAGLQKLKEAHTRSLRGQVDILRYNISKHGQLARLKEAVVSGADNKITVKVRSGSDVVRLNYHHLPYLLFLNDRGTWASLKDFYMAMAEISEIVSESARAIDPIIRFLGDLFRSLQAENVSKDSMEFLILIYIGMLEIDESDPTPGMNLESEMITLLKDREWQASLLNRARDVTARRGRKAAATEEPEQNERRYLLLWLYRRNGMFEEIDAMEAAISPLDRDPRIWHGLGLAYEARFYALGRLSSDRWLISRSIRYLSAAERGYETLLRTVDENFGYIRNLLIKSIIGINNSNLDSFLQSFSFNGNPKDLRRARDILTRMKLRMGEINADFNKVPILNHTEAELEYYEARLLFERLEIEKAWEKINHAKDRFNRVIESPSFIGEESTKIIGNINSLMATIGALR